MVNEDTQSWIQAPADSTGKKLDSRYFTTAAGTVVHREVVAIGGTAVGQITFVTAGGLQTYVPGYLRPQSPTAASFLVTAKSLSLTAASFLATASLPGYARIQSATAASTLVTAKSLSLTAASFLATVAAPGYVRAQNPTTAASFLVTSTNPGYARGVSATAASFLVTAKAISLTAASFLNTSINPGYARDLSGTAASFLVTAKCISLSAASFAAQAVNVFTARSTWPTAEANAFTGATAIVDLQRRLIVIPYSFPEKTQGTTIAVTSTVPVAVFGATTGERNYLTTIMASNSSATATRVDFYDRTTAGRELVTAYIAAAGGGFALPILTPIRGNTASTVVVRVTPTVTSVLVTAFGYSAP